jgi:hypothetical protein
MTVGGLGIVLGSVGEQAGGFDDDVHAHGFPRQLGRRLGAHDLHFLAIDHEDVVLGFVRGRLPGADLAVEAALGGVVLEQIRQVVRGDDIAHRDDFHVFADHALFGDGAKHQAPDASEPVTCDFYCHRSISPVSSTKI